MKLNSRLYGTHEVPKIPQSIIDSRIAILKKEIKKENKAHFLYRDLARIDEMVRAINFWSNINDN